MSAVPKRKLTEAEYLAIERAAEFKSEFYAGEMFAMAGASPAHNRLKENLILELGTRLRGGPCHTYSSDQRVRVDRTGLYTYPDLVVVCGKDEVDPADRDTLVNPTVIVEVLSPSTAKYDRGKKFDHYRTIASLREYVLVWQDEVRVERFVRRPDGEWGLTVLTQPADVLALAAVPAQVSVADVYAGVELPEQPLR